MRSCSHVLQGRKGNTWTQLSSHSRIESLFPSLSLQGRDSSVSNGRESEKPDAMQYWRSFESQVWQGVFLPESTFSAGSLSASVQPPVCDRMHTLSTFLPPSPPPRPPLFCSWVNSALEKGFIVVINISAPIENPKHWQPSLYHHLGHRNTLRTLIQMGSAALAAAAVPDPGKAT